jgi:hypothetical protein
MVIVMVIVMVSVIVVVLSCFVVLLVTFSLNLVRVVVDPPEKYHKKKVPATNHHLYP